MMYSLVFGVALLLVQFQALRAACGGLLIASDDVKAITSPNYPRKYPKSTDCLWRITSARKPIKITVKNYSLEKNSACGYDSLDIHYDGYTEKLCGNSSDPLTYVSPSGAVFVVFHSDSSEQFPGFNLTYEVAHPIPACLGTVQNLTAETESQILRTPEYYAARTSSFNEINCEWNIEAERGFVEITLEQYDFYASTLCSDSGLEIYNAKDDPFPVTRLCGPSASGNLSFWTESNKAYVRLYSHVSAPHMNFKLVYKYVEEPLKNPVGFGGLIVLQASDSDQILKSPGYPHDYPDLVNCVWRIESPLDLVQVTVEDYSLDLCSNDTLVIADFLDSSPIAKLQGSSDMRRRVLLSSSNVTFIHFFSDASGTDRGFRLTYKAVKLDQNEKEESSCKLPSNLLMWLCMVEGVAILGIGGLAIFLCKRRRRTSQPASHKTDGQGISSHGIKDKRVEDKEQGHGMKSKQGISSHGIKDKRSADKEQGHGIKSQPRQALKPKVPHQDVHLNDTVMKDSSYHTTRRGTGSGEESKEEEENLYEEFNPGHYENA